MLTEIAFQYPKTPKPHLIHFEQESIIFLIFQCIRRFFVFIYLILLNNIKLFTFSILFRATGWGFIVSDLLVFFKLKFFFSFLKIFKFESILIKLLYSHLDFENFLTYPSVFFHMRDKFPKESRSTILSANLYCSTWKSLFTHIAPFEFNQFFD